MIKRFKNLENTFTISKAATIVGVLTLLAKLVAIVRDPLFASKFGGKNIFILDIYNSAFRIPDFITNLLILGTLSVAFIPVFVDISLQDKARANRIANTVLNAMSLGMIAICAVIYALATPLTKWLVPGFSGYELEATIRLTRLFLLSPIIFGASNVFTSILYANKKFLMASVAPLLYNVGILFGLLVLYPRYGLMGLGYGVIAGACCHLLVQIPESVSHGFSWQPVLDFKDAAFRKIVTLFVPKIIVIDIGSFSLIVATIIGSLLPAGTISIFNFANNLVAAPVGIFALSISIASFPSLSELFAKKQEENFLSVLVKTMVQILFFMIPFSILLLLLRAQLVRLYLGHGNFTWTDTILTFSTLGVMTFSLFSQSLSPLLTRAFYARQNTVIPVIVNLASMALNIITAYWFSSAYHLGVVGLGLSFSITSIFNCFALMIILHLRLLKDAGQEFTETIVAEEKMFSFYVVKILIASLVMGILSYLTLYAIAPVVNTRTNLGLFLQAGASGTVGLISFMICAVYLRIPQALRIMKLVRERLKFAKILNLKP